MGRSKSGSINVINPTTGSRLHLNTRLWPFLTPLLLAGWLLWPHRLWPTLLIILGGTWLAALFWALALKRGLSLDRRMGSAWGQVGDRMEERFTITNTSHLTGWSLEVDDLSNMPAYPAGRVTQIRGRQVMEWRMAGTCSHRGLFTVGPTSLRSGDPFGFFSAEIIDPRTSVLLILPHILPLPEITIATGGRAGQGRRPRRSALETTVSTDSVRYYYPGEPLKSIHWPTSARRESLFVRQFENTPTADWWIFLDLEKEHLFGNGYDSIEEHAVILAASMAARGLRQGHNVGLVTAGPGIISIPPRRSSSQLMEILSQLALVHPGQTPLAHLLKSTRRSMQHGASILLITSDPQGKWLADLLPLTRVGIAPTVLLLDPASYGGVDPVTGISALLSRHSISNHIIPRSLLNRTELQPERVGKWEWRLVGPGKGVVIHHPLVKDRWHQA